MLKNISFQDALQRVMEFSSDECAVMHHPKYPKPPNGVFNIFAKKKGYSSVNLPASLRAAFHDKTDPDIAASQAEALIEKNKYPDALEQFMNENDDLMKEHIEFIKKKIRKLRNKANVIF